jgi:hypothetical protein
MKWSIGKVDCDYLILKVRHLPAIGGQSCMMQNPICTKDGAPNFFPSLDRPFAENCRECPENRWNEG